MQYAWVRVRMLEAKTIFLRLKHTAVLSPSNKGSERTCERQDSRDVMNGVMSDGRSVATPVPNSLRPLTAPASRISLSRPEWPVFAEDPAPSPHDRSLGRVGLSLTLPLYSMPIAGGSFYVSAIPSLCPRYLPCMRECFNSRLGHLSRFFVLFFSLARVSTTRGVLAMRSAVDSISVRYNQRRCAPSGRPLCVRHSSSSCNV